MSSYGECKHAPVLHLRPAVWIEYHSRHALQGGTHWHRIPPSLHCWHLRCRPAQTTMKCMAPYRQASNLPHRPPRSCPASQGRWPAAAAPRRPRGTASAPTPQQPRTCSKQQSNEAAVAAKLNTWTRKVQWAAASSTMCFSHSFPRMQLPQRWLAQRRSPPTSPAAPSSTAHFSSASAMAPCLNSAAPSSYSTCARASSRGSTWQRQKEGIHHRLFNSTNDHPCSGSPAMAPFAHKAPARTCPNPQTPCMPHGAKQRHCTAPRHTSVPRALR